MANISGIVKSVRNIMRQDNGTSSDELRILQLGWMIFFKIFSDKEKELELIQDNYKSPIPDALHWDKWAGNDEGMTGDELLNFVDRKLFPTLADLDLKLVLDEQGKVNKRALLVREVFADNYNYMKSGIHLRQVINKLNEIDFNRSKDKQVFGQIYETFLGELQSAGTLGEFYTPRALTELMAELLDPTPEEIGARSGLRHWRLSHRCFGASQGQGRNCGRAGGDSGKRDGLGIQAAALFAGQHQPDSS